MLIKIKILTLIKFKRKNSPLIQLNKMKILIENFLDNNLNFSSFTKGKSYKLSHM